MATVLTAYSATNNQPHLVRIADDAGTEVAEVAAVFGGGTSYRYTVDVPAALSPGYYTYSLHRSNAQRSLRAQGEFVWDGVAILRPVSLAEVNAARDAILADIAAIDIDLSPVIDLLEADEELTITNGTGTAVKKLKGTSTVLVSKDVNTTVSCDTATTLTE